VVAQRESVQAMCDGLMKMGDILASAAIDQHGNLLGVNYGHLQMDDQLKHDFSEIATVVWGGIQRGITIGGPLKMVSAVFENFKVLFVPAEGTKLILLIAVEVTVNSDVMRERIADFMKYWLKVNHYVE